MNNIKQVLKAIPPELFPVTHEQIMNAVELDMEKLSSDTLKTVEETFEEEVFARSAETVLGTETWIEGKDNFLKKIKEKLNKLKGVENLENNQTRS